MKLKIGQKVQFVTMYPGHEGETVVGTVVYVGDSRFPCNPLYYDRIWASRSFS